jgi:uncharacterized OB-fold protein
VAFCTECGSRVEKTDKFCSSCGSRVQESVVVDQKSKVETIKSDETGSAPKNEPIIATAISNARIAPVYGSGYKAGVHCNNCGAKPGNGRQCNVCQIEL